MAELGNASWDKQKLLLTCLVPSLKSKFCKQKMAAGKIFLQANGFLEQRFYQFYHLTCHQAALQLITKPTLTIPVNPEKKSLCLSLSLSLSHTHTHTHTHTYTHLEEL